jgi:hypothetical protein
MALIRFASHTEDEIIQIRLTHVPVNTEKNNKKTASLLREYLTKTEKSSSFEALSAQQLNDVLKHVYLSARKAYGEMYKVNILESTRYSLNRYLKSPPVQKTFDIMKDDIRLYCFRRGDENMRRMTKTRLLLKLTLKLIGNMLQKTLMN